MPFNHADNQRSVVLAEIEKLRHQRNVASEQIAKMRKQGENADEMMAEMRSVGERIKQLEKTLAVHEKRLDDILLGIPNIPDPSVPVGRDEADNPVVKTVGTPPEFDFDIKGHWESGEQLGILDFARAAKITGARFPLYLGAGARLERALINFMLDIHTGEHGYTEVLPPFIVNRQTMTNTGQLPKFEEDLFKLENWDYFLIPTAEVPVTNIHQGEILAEEQLPVRYNRLHPLFSFRGWILRQGHTRADPPASVQQSRVGQIRPSGDLLRGAGEPAAKCRDDPAAPGTALPGDHALHRRSGLLGSQNL